MTVRVGFLRAVNLGKRKVQMARLKALTAGQAAWTMSLSHYEQAPSTLQQQLASEYAKHRKHEED